MGLFGKSLTAEEQVKKWRATLRSEQRQIDKSIRDIQSEEAKVKLAIKQAAKRGDMVNCKTLAKELVHSHKAVDRLHTSKAQMNSVLMQLQDQLASAKLVGAMKQSTAIMKSIGQLTKLPEIQKTMMELQKEMMKAGVIQEMMEDAIDNQDDEEIEEDIDAEVNKVLWEATKGVLGQGPSVPTDKGKARAVADEEDEEEPEIERMQARLAALQD